MHRFHGISSRLTTSETQSDHINDRQKLLDKIKGNDVTNVPVPQEGQDSTNGRSPSSDMGQMVVKGRDVAKNLVTMKSSSSPGPASLRKPHLSPQTCMRSPKPTKSIATKRDVVARECLQETSMKNQRSVRPRTTMEVINLQLVKMKSKIPSRALTWDPKSTESTASKELTDMHTIGAKQRKLPTKDSQYEKSQKKLITSLSQTLKRFSEGS